MMKEPYSGREERSSTGASKQAKEGCAVRSRGGERPGEFPFGDGGGEEGMGERVVRKNENAKLACIQIDGVGNEGDLSTGNRRRK